MRTARSGTNLAHALACALLVSTTAYARDVPAPRPPIAITDVTVIDVERGRRHAARTVLIDAGRIAAIGRSTEVAVPPDAVRLDGRGRFLVPGLIDLHVHLFNNASQRPPNEWAFPLFIANGVTGVREMQTRPEALAQVHAWRESVERGDRVAPRVLAAGVAVTGPSIDAARAQVRAAAAAGADFIKVYSELPPDAWRATLDEARAAGLALDGHAPAGVPWTVAADAGQRTNEHLMQLYEACSTRGPALIDARLQRDGDAAAALRDAQEPQVLATFDRRTCRRAVAGRAQAQVPTLVLGHHEATRPVPDPRADPRWPLLRADEQQRWTRILAVRDAEDAALAARRRSVSCAIVRTLVDSGVPVLAGTDAPMPLVYPGYALHEELELLVACGLRPAQALRAATADAAQLLGQSRDAGSVAVGRRADLVLLDRDPLRDVRHLRCIRAVVLAGRLFGRADLDAMLAAPDATAAVRPSAATTCAKPARGQ